MRHGSRRERESDSDSDSGSLDDDAEHLFRQSRAKRGDSRWDGKRRRGIREHRRQVSSSDSSSDDDSDESSSSDSSSGSDSSWSDSSYTGPRKKGSPHSTIIGPWQVGAKLTHVATKMLFIGAGIILSIVVIVIVVFISIKSKATAEGSTSPNSGAGGAASNQGTSAGGGATGQMSSISQESRTSVSSASSKSEAGVASSKATTSASATGSASGAAKTLATGSYIMYGSVGTGLQYQASGILTRGGCDAAATIQDCYHTQLDSTGNLQDTTSKSLASATADPAAAKRSVHRNSTSVNLSYLLEIHARATSPRQRTEFVSTPNAPSGESWKYTWKYFLSKDTSTTKNFCHLTQIISRGTPGGPVITLDAVNDQISVNDFFRTGQHSNTIPLSSYVGVTTQHVMLYTYGSSGSVDYQVTNAATGETLLSYNATGDMGEDGSVKFGMYRAVVDGLQPGSASVGDYTATKQ